MSVQPNLRAFHGNPALKATILEKLWEDREGGNFRPDGIPVKCLTGDPQGHHLYPSKFGLPEWLAILEDRMFRGLPDGDQLKLLFPEMLIEAIPVGADLALVMHRFLLWLLVDGEHGVIRFVERSVTRREGERVKAAIQKVADLHRRIVDGGNVEEEEWTLASREAYAASLESGYAASEAARTAYLAGEAVVTAIRVSQAAETAVTAARTAAIHDPRRVASVHEAAQASDAAAWGAMEVRLLEFLDGAGDRVSC